MARAGLRAAAAAGWVVDESGAYLLEQFRRDYHGGRGSFTDLTGYEAAVNGRGIPDFDLVEAGAERVQMLVRRAYAFAWMALFGLRGGPGRAVVTAYISIGPTLMDEELYTGSVTFCAAHDGGEPYIADIGSESGNALLALDSTECETALPEG